MNQPLKLNLKKPLCFFDLETTGLQIGKDKIVEIAVIKVNPDGEEETLHLYIDPEMEVPAASVAVHGLSRQILLEKGAKPFKEEAQKIAGFMEGCDLAGFNSNKFDIPFLAEELKNAGIDFNVAGRFMVDVQNIFHKMEPRNLKAAYNFYVGDNAFDHPHSAVDDTLATVKILKAQIARYEGVEYEDKNGVKSKPVVNDIAALSNFSTVRKTADLAGRIGYDEEGQEIFTFGQNKGKRLREFYKEDKGKGYFRWMLDSDFPEDTKKVLRTIMEEVKMAAKIEQLKQLF